MEMGIAGFCFQFFGAALVPQALQALIMYYDADKAIIPAYLKADKPLMAIISISRIYR